METTNLSRITPTELKKKVTGRTFILTRTRKTQMAETPYGRSVLVRFDGDGKYTYYDTDEQVFATVDPLKGTDDFIGTFAISNAGFDFDIRHKHNGFETIERFYETRV